MARTLNEQASTPYHRGSLDYAGARTPQPAYNTVPGFAIPNARGASPAPPSWNPWSYASSPPPPSSMTPSFPLPYQSPAYAPSTYPPRQDDLVSSMAALSLPQQDYPNPYNQRVASMADTVSSPPQQPPPTPQPGRQYTSPGAAPPVATTGPSGTAPPSLTAPLPTVAGLTTLVPSVRQAGYDPVQKVAWCRDVLSLVNRAEGLQVTGANPVNVVSTDVAVGPVRIGDPQLQRLIDVAIPLVIEISSPNPMPRPTPAHISEAVYLRATCEASGAFPQFIKRDPRTAFRDFEFAARHGYPAAWFRIGRDYENFGDVPHAKDAFERGVKVGDERCLYVSLIIALYSCY